MKPECITRAQDMVQDQHPALIPSFLTFMCNQVNLPKSTSPPTINNVTPTVWWMSVENTNAIDTSLCRLARKLLVMPASPAIEHIFSNFGLIHTRIKN